MADAEQDPELAAALAASLADQSQQAAEGDEAPKADEAPASEEQKNETAVVTEEAAAVAAAAAVTVEDDPNDTREKYSMDGDLFRKLVGMGFSENGVKKSIISGCINEDTCLQWLEMHLDMKEELDKPIDETQINFVIKEKKHYTPEELAEKVAEMKEKIAKVKARAAADEAERDRTREKQRIADGKAMLQSKEEREKRQRLEAYDEMRKQKLADAAAREKIQLQLAVDRKVRSGMPVEQAEKEAERELAEKKAQLEVEQRKRAEEREKERLAYEQQKKENQSGGGGGWNLSSLIQEAEGDTLSDVPDPTGGSGAASRSSATAATTAPSGPAAPEPSVEELPQATQDNFSYLLAQLQGSASPATHTVTDAQKLACLQTLRLIATNIVKHPLELKYRTLKKNTAVFSKKLAPVPHAVGFLMTMGFRSEVTGEPMLLMRTFVLARVQAAIAALNMVLPPQQQ